MPAGAFKATLQRVQMRSELGEQRAPSQRICDHFFKLFGVGVSCDDPFAKGIPHFCRVRWIRECWHSV